MGVQFKAYMSTLAILLLSFWWF